MFCYYVPGAMTFLSFFCFFFPLVWLWHCSEKKKWFYACTCLLCLLICLVSNHCSTTAIPTPPPLALPLLNVQKYSESHAFKSLRTYDSTEDNRYTIFVPAFRKIKNSNIISVIWNNYYHCDSLEIFIILTHVHPLPQPPYPMPGRIDFIWPSSQGIWCIFWPYLKQTC